MEPELKQTYELRPSTFAFGHVHYLPAQWNALPTKPPKSALKTELGKPRKLRVHSDSPRCEQIAALQKRHLLPHFSLRYVGIVGP